MIILPIVELQKKNAYFFNILKNVKKITYGTRIETIIWVKLQTEEILEIW